MGIRRAGYQAGCEYLTNNVPDDNHIGVTNYNKKYSKEIGITDSAYYIQVIALRKMLETSPMNITIEERPENGH